MENNKDILLSNKNIRLRSNSPTDLHEEDLFNTLPKAQSIKDFIKSHPDSLLENRMLVLYGEWGSGKTSILKYIKEEVEDDFETVFLEAWHHEKDDNLALSLLDAIYEKVGNKDDIKEAFNSLYSVIKGFAKSTKFNFGLVSIDNKEFLEEIEKQEMKSELSLYEKNRKFQENFTKIEDAILKNTNKKLLVFVDDLDRCEPENVLNLLAAIKLFFTYGQNTIYFCALDKEAVTKAVTLQYGDVIKSDEYLEKVFDISFTMPKSSDVSKVLRYYFDEHKYATDSETNDQVIDRLYEFIYKIDFTNPRHLKKVLNKYLVVEYFKKKQIGGHDLIPDIILNQGGSIINIVFVLYFIILYEFFPSKFIEIEQYELKKMHYANAHYQYLKKTGSTTASIPPLNEMQSIIRSSMLSNLDKITFNELAINHCNGNFYKIINIFTPKTIENFALYGDVGGNIPQYLSQFINPDDDILISFAYYLHDKNEEFKKNKYDYRFWNLFEMAKTIL
jgi:hypothetical protein